MYKVYDYRQIDSEWLNRRTNALFVPIKKYFHEYLLGFHKKYDHTIML